jgi:hypothetical protein
MRNRMIPAPPGIIHLHTATPASNMTVQEGMATKKHDCSRNDERDSIGQMDR